MWVDTWWSCYASLVLGCIDSSFSSLIYSSVLFLSSGSLRFFFQCLVFSFLLFHTSSSPPTFSFAASYPHCLPFFWDIRTFITSSCGFHCYWYSCDLSISSSVTLVQFGSVMSLFPHSASLSSASLFSSRSLMHFRPISSSSSFFHTPFCVSILSPLISLSSSTSFPLSSASPSPLPLHTLLCVTLIAPCVSGRLLVSSLGWCSVYGMIFGSHSLFANWLIRLF